MSNKIPIFFDASALKNASCFRHFWRSVVQGYKSKGKEARGHAMAYGSGIHKFLEVLYKGGTKRDGLQVALDYYTPWDKTLNLTNFEFRTASNLLKVCNKYHRVFLSNDKLDFTPLTDKDGKKLVEYKFSVKIWENDTYILYLAGTIDLICEYEGYTNLIVDHKSTSVREDHGKFFSQYDWDIQPMLYSKVWREANGLDNYPPVLINGIFVKKPTKKAEEAGGMFDGVEFDRSGVIEYDDDRMSKFTDWLNKRVKSIIYYLENPLLNPLDNYEMAACKSIYGTCPFFGVCKLPEEYQASALEQEFEIIKYNPLKFRD